MLGMRQLRVGPNKPLFMGFLIPFLDGLKLFKKEVVVPFRASSLYFYLAPVTMFMLLFFSFLVLPYEARLLRFTYSGLFFLCVVGLSVYPVFFSGVSCKSKYAYLGRLRGMSQRVSFEVAFFLGIFLLFLGFQRYMLLCNSECFLFPLFLFYFIFALAELGRTPFDFIEGESELVRGYNVEYRGVYFAVVFLREYGFMLFYSSLLSMLLFG